MGVFVTQMKTHSRKDITDTVGELNPCIKHNLMPVVYEIVAGKRKEVYYHVSCGHDCCGKLSMQLKIATEAWNKWNQRQKEEE